jgi:hypothetical protein
VPPLSVHRRINRLPLRLCWTVAFSQPPALLNGTIVIVARGTKLRGTAQRCPQSNETGHADDIVAPPP